MISILQGSVRVAATGEWPDAKRILSEMVEAHYRPNGPATIMNPLAREHYDTEVANLAASPVACHTPGETLLVISGGYAYAIKSAHESAGPRGLGKGDLALIHEHSNGNRDWYTVDVKCKIISVSGHDSRPVTATVQITGDSVQFTRGETVTMPASFLRPRKR